MLMEGGSYPLYARTAVQGVQLFLAGCAGLLTPTETLAYLLYPGLTAAGQGADTPGNRAFTQWSGHLRAGVALTDEVCNDLHALWRQSGLCDLRWSVLTPEQQARPFELLMVLPTRLDVEINGFNGRLLAGVPSGYGWYVEQYGTKWPGGYDLTVCDRGADWLTVDFDTPWSPPADAVMAARDGGALVCGAGLRLLRLRPLRGREADGAHLQHAGVE